MFGIFLDEQSILGIYFHKLTWNLVHEQNKQADIGNGSVSL